MQLHSLIALCCVALVYAQTPDIPPFETRTACGAGETPIMVLVDMKSVAFTVLAESSAQSLAECQGRCVGSDACAGFQFDGKPGDQCIQMSDVTPPYTDSNGPKIYLKQCVATQDVCVSPFIFEATPNKILVGFARDVVTVATYEECLLECLQSINKRAFECESAMFYPNDGECILNTEDRRDRPDLFIPEPNDPVVYFDNNCAGSQCFAPYVSQYIQVSEHKLEETGNEIPIENQSLEGCTALCNLRLNPTGEPYNCKSYMYNAAQRLCTLSDERSKPLGRAVLVADPAFNYYEKKCFKAKNTCRDVPAYTRFEQKILVGFAAFVLNSVPSVTMCLDSCANPPDQVGADFVCKSAMYYYNEQECILNNESMENQPNLFIDEGDDFKVDYFDIACGLEPETNCPTGRQFTSVFVKDHKLTQQLEPENADDTDTLPNAFVLQTTTGDFTEWLNTCFQMNPEKCRSWNSVGSDTSYLYLSSDTGDLVPAPGTDYHELMCLADSCEGEPSAQWWQKKKISSTPTETITGPLSREQCIDKCLEKGGECHGVNFDTSNGDCSLYGSDICQGGGDSCTVDADTQLVDDEDVDFYRMVCSKPAAKWRLRGDLKFKRLRQTQKKISKQRKLELRSVPADCTPETICNFDGMKVNVNCGGKFTGAVFAKMKYDTCRVEVNMESSAMLHLGYPTEKAPKPLEVVRAKRQAGGSYLVGPPVQPQQYTEPAKPQPDPYGVQPPSTPVVVNPPAFKPRDCGVQDLGNGTIRTTIVVQKNMLGIPGLVTSDDKIYTVSCNYKDMNEETKTVTSNMHVEGPQAAIIKPRGKIELSSPVMMGMNSISAPSASGDENPSIVKANLGDILELHWEMMALDETMDFFVKECVAERGGPVVHAPASPLTVAAPSVLPPGIAPPGQAQNNAQPDPYGPPPQLNPAPPPAPSYPQPEQNPAPPPVYPPPQQNPAPPPPAPTYPVPAPSYQPPPQQNPAPQERTYQPPQQPPYREKRQVAHGSLSPEEQEKLSKLTLIEKGCPTPAVAQTLMREPVVKVDDKVKTVKLQAFRFDGSSSIRITCKLEICKDECNPTTCPINGTDHESFGRKKRGVEGNTVKLDYEQKYETGRYTIPRFTHASATVMIVDRDPLQDIEQHQNNYHAKSPTMEMTRDAVFDELPPSKQAYHDQFCLPKTAFFAVFVFLGGVALIQASVVAAYVVRRISTPKGYY